MSIVLWIISLIPILLIIYGLNYFDKIEQESRKLLIILFAGGFLVYPLVRVITRVFSSFIPFLLESHLEEFSIALITFAGIALIEELSKYLMLNILTWKNKEFNEVYDGVLYGVIISLGFAAIENLFYLWDGGLGTLIIRCAFSIPAHACFGVIMGYYYGYAKYYKKREFESTKSLYNRYAAFFITMVLHGIYDYLLSSTFEYIFIVFIIFDLIMIIVSILKIRELYKYELSFDN